MIGLIEGSKKYCEGKVEWFNRAKGYGFINCEEIEKNVFVHRHSVIDDIDGMASGAVVTFLLDESSPKGPQATNVTVVKPAEVVQSA